MIFFSILDFDFVFCEALNKFFESIVVVDWICDLIGIVINNVVVVCVCVIFSL